MSEQDSHLDEALRQGLATLPVPAASDAFDERVLAAVRRPTPWWIALRPALRQGLPAAACSLLLTLLMIRWAAQAPVQASSHAPAASTPALMVDRILDQPTLTAGAFTRLSLMRSTAVSQNPPQPSAPARRSEAHVWVRG